VRKEQQATQVELDRRVQNLASILDFMAKPIAALDTEVQRQLVLLAGAIARHIVRRELQTQPDEIVAVIRETVALLPMTARDIRVHLNPEDAKLVRSRVVEAGSDRSWNIAEDPLISRGGCRVSSENSTIDATLEQRLGAVIASALGDSRTADAQEGT
jgi:flagellar assembly protein FliH